MHEPPCISPLLFHFCKFFHQLFSDLLFFLLIPFTFLFQASPPPCARSFSQLIFLSHTLGSLSFTMFGCYFSELSSLRFAGIFLSVHLASRHLGHTNYCFSEPLCIAQCAVSRATSTIQSQLHAAAAQL